MRLWFNCVLELYECRWYCIDARQRYFSCMQLLSTGAVFYTFVLQRSPVFCVVRLHSAAGKLCSVADSADCCGLEIVWEFVDKTVAMAAAFQKQI